MSRARKGLVSLDTTPIQRLQIGCCESFKLLGCLSLYEFLIRTYYSHLLVFPPRLSFFVLIEALDQWYECFL